MSTLTVTSVPTTGNLRGDLMDQALDDIANYLNGQSGGIDGINIQASALLSLPQLSQPNALTTVSVVLTVAGMQSSWLYGRDNLTAIGMRATFVKSDTNPCSARIGLRSADPTFAAGWTGASLGLTGVSGRVLTYDENVAGNVGNWRAPVFKPYPMDREILMVGSDTWSGNVTLIVVTVLLSGKHWP